MPKLKLFLSSTSDLVAERRTLVAELRNIFDVYAYEDDPAGEYSPEQHLLEKIQQSNLFVGIIGNKFGSTLPDSKPEMSIVEWELKAARETAGVKILIFLKSQDLQSISDIRQKEFILRINDFFEGSWNPTFAGPDSLCIRVMKSVLLWQQEQLERVQTNISAGLGSKRYKVILCDRDKQWGYLTKYALERNSQAIFLTGDFQEGLQFFLKRIHEHWPLAPQRTILPVKWDFPPPRSKDGFLSALSVSLSCDVKHLESCMKERATDNNVLLVHEPVFEDTEDNDSLYYYYSEWLPEIIRKVDSNPDDYDRIWGLKFIQAFSWHTPIKRQRHHVAKPILSNRKAVERMMKRFKQKPNSALPILELKEWKRITKKEVKDWALNEAKLDEKMIDGFLEKIFIENSGSSSRDILQRMSDLLGG